MRLTPKTRIEELTREYPFIIDYMPTLSPKFTRLKSPFVRRTMGAIATMEKVASMGGFQVDKLLYTIAGEIERRTGKRVDVILGDAPPPDPVSDDRKEILRDIIRSLHEGEDPETLKLRFAELIGDLSPGELGQVEQSLIDEGLPEIEVKKLCNLHVEVFKEGLDKGDVPKMPGGHPVHTMMMENRAAENILAEIDTAVCDLGDPPDAGVFSERQEVLLKELDTLSQLDKHYLRKEHQLFPALESHGLSGPPQVMWAVHDDIRADLKAVIGHVGSGAAQDTVETVTKVSNAIKDMIYKEEHILFPMCIENLTEAEWVKVSTGEEELGYAWIEPSDGWEPHVVPEDAGTSPAAEAPDGPATVGLDTGNLTAEQINLLLKHLPLDITLVDDNDQVAYYSATDDRIFPRSPGIIGRKVSKCHPPKSVHIVEHIVSTFKSGERDSAEFWLEVGGRFVHIRYFALRDGDGAYRGTIEVSQDATDIRALEGEQRLLDWV